MEDQDRSKWDFALIEQAKHFLDESAEGTRISPYHLEAGIALHHCRAPSFAETDWAAILRFYDALLTIFPSPIYFLNRAIVLAALAVPQAGIRALEQAGHAESLRHYHLYDATLGELHRRAGNLAQARRFLEAARRKTSSPSDREILDRRLAICR